MANIMRVGGGAGGGGLTFNVVGGTTLPNSPKENTVWVNTSTAIENVYAQVYAPANPVSGDVWINTHVTLDAYGNPIVSDTLTMTVSESPIIRISAKSGQQWDGSAWKKCSTRVYKNGAWSPDVLVILMDGVWGSLGQPTKAFKNADHTSISSMLSFSYVDGYMFVKAIYNGADLYRLYITTPIDVSPYNTMMVVGYSVSSLVYGWAFLNSTIKGSSSTTDDDYSASQIKGGTATSPVTLTTDISSANGQMYFGVGIKSNGSSGYPQAHFREIVLSV